MSELLRSKIEADLAQLSVALRESSSRYRAIAAKNAVDNAPLFAKLASRRDNEARAIELITRELGYLPDAPDPEHTAIAEWGDNIVDFLADDRGRTLIDRFIEREEQLSRLLEESIISGEALNSVHWECLRRIKQHIDIDIADLESARSQSAA